MPASQSFLTVVVERWTRRANSRVVKKAESSVSAIECRALLIRARAQPHAARRRRGPFPRSRPGGLARPLLPLPGMLPLRASGTRRSRSSAGHRTACRRSCGAPGNTADDRPAMLDGRRCWRDQGTAVGTVIEVADRVRVGFLVARGVTSNGSWAVLLTKADA